MALHVRRLPPLHHVLLLMLAPACTLDGLLAAEQVKGADWPAALPLAHERLSLLQALDCFLAGDDIPAKKPDPSIYKLASERLGVKPEDCLVIEDSKIGLQAS